MPLIVNHACVECMGMCSYVVKVNAIHMKIMRSFEIKEKRLISGRYTIETKQRCNQVGAFKIYVKDDNA